MARNAKSRKLRNKKMKGGELSWWCRNVDICDDAGRKEKNATQAAAKAAAETAELNDYSKHNFSNANLGVISDPVKPINSPHTSTGGKFRGGKSNRRRNKKSKKSRRTRRR
jgi:hypothetical protein